MVALKQTNPPKTIPLCYKSQTPLVFLSYVCLYNHGSTLSQKNSEGSNANLISV